MLEKILSPDTPVQERAEALRALSTVQTLETLHAYNAVAQDPSPYMRAAVAEAYGKLKTREAFEPLILLMTDPDPFVRQQAVLGLGISRDSRALFPLVNYFKHADLDMKRHVVDAVIALHDPRAGPWLNALEGYDDAVIAEKCKNAIAASPAPFHYRFKGPEHLLHKAQLEHERHVIAKPEDLDPLEQTFRIFASFNRPQTYVVSTDFEFILGGNVQEHVVVASGREVVTAGETILEKRDGKWTVIYANQRSNGYHPAASTFPFFARATSSAGLIIPGEWTETYPREGYFNDDFLASEKFYKRPEGL